MERKWWREVAYTFPSLFCSKVAQSTSILARAKDEGGTHISSTPPPSNSPLLWITERLCLDCRWLGQLAWILPETFPTSLGQGS